MRRAPCQDPAERERIVELVRPIETRVGAPAAAMCYDDNSPPPVVSEIAPGIKVLRGEGRPSKHLRRELDRMRRIARGCYLLANASR